MTRGLPSSLATLALCSLAACAAGERWQGSPATTERIASPTSLEGNPPVLTPRVVDQGRVTRADAGAGRPLAPPDARVVPTRQVVVVLEASRRSQWGRIETELGRDHALRKIRDFPLASIGVQCIVYAIPDDRSIDRVVQRLRADSRVDDAQPNRTFIGLAEPATYTSLQWASQAFGAERMDHAATGKGVTIAVVDTGADTHHPDLAGSIASTLDLIDAEGDAFDSDRHGTAVAGIISARPNGRRGIRGVAPDARLLLIRACRQGTRDKAQCLSWTIARAIDAAILGSARIINLSLAGPPDALIARLIDRAEQAGVIVVAAAEAERPTFPAALKPVIGVLSSDVGGQVARPAWKKSGELIAAPGVDVITTVPGGHYDFLSGSSLSSAHISGLVALLLESHPVSTPQAMRTALARSIEPARHDALEAARAAPARKEPPTPGLPDAAAAERALQSLGAM